MKYRIIITVFALLYIKYANAQTLELPDVCTSQEKTYTIGSPEDNTSYYWGISGGEILQKSGNDITVKWSDTEGVGTLSVYGKFASTECKSEIAIYSVKRKQIPTAEFDNASVCYGEPLKVILSGTAPFEVFYSLDGQEKSFTTKETEFQMANIPGNYLITKVKNGACESTPTTNSSAVIVPKLKKLTIIEKD